MSPLLANALEEARAVFGGRGWVEPGEAAIREAQRLLQLTEANWPAPEVEVDRDGQIALEWDAGGRGWLRVAMTGEGTAAHSAVIDEDEYGKVEDFGDAVPEWVQHLLERLFG